MSKKPIRKEPRILLINPWIYDFTAYDFWSKPLGILYIASLLRKMVYQIDFIDCMDRYDQELLTLQNCLFPEKDDDGSGPFHKEHVPKPRALQDIPRNYSRYGITEGIFLGKIQRLARPDVILVTSIMSYWYPGVFRVIELVKSVYPDCPVILGGIYAKLCYQHAVSFAGADYVLNDFQVHRLIQLLHYLTENSPVATLAKNHFQCLDCFPRPAWDLYRHLDFVCLLTSRGCSHRCSYCASYLINPEQEFRSPEHIVEEIIDWKIRKGIHRFVFYDDALLFDAENHFIPFMKELQKQRVRVNFYTPNAIHAGLITPLIARLMVINGFKKVWLGFETADHHLQKKTGSKIDNPTFQKAIQILLDEGFSREQIRAYVLVGLPGQNVKSIIDSINFVMDTGIKPYLAKFSPIPGTRIWSQAVKEYGWKEPVDPLWHNDALMPYFSPSIHAQQYQGFKKLLQQYKISG